VRNAIDSLSPKSENARGRKRITFADRFSKQQLVLSSAIFGMERAAFFKR
jgi:hypothetical protein